VTFASTVQNPPPLQDTIQQKELRILLLEDNPSHAEIVEKVMRDGGLKFSITRVETREAFQSHLELSPPDLILSDYALPSFDGSTALTIAKRKTPDVPFIFVTGTMGEEVAIETLKSGATDYVLKTRLVRLVPSVWRALRESAERRERRRAEEQLRRSHEQLRALTSYLQYVREEERTRISREVHDELGQDLTGLKLDLAWIARHLPKQGRGVLLHKIKTMQTGIDATIQTVRRISTELRPGILDSLGLVAAIEWQAAEFQTRTGISCNVTTTVSDTLWDQDFTTAFFRIFQETLTNIIRHANAKRVEVKLGLEGRRLVLTVADNGRGITEEESSNTRSIGLIGMRERAALVGGELTIEGAPGRGTLVRVSIPLPVPPRTGVATTSDEHPHENPHHG
jgi:signal transduction histidine kinase